MIEQYSAGKSKEGAIKLSSNESSYGLSDKTIEALKNDLSSIHRYPDSSHEDLKEKLSEYLATDQNKIIIGNGSDEIINFICNCYLGQNEIALGALETFSVYRIATQIAKGQYHGIALKDGYFDMDSILSELSQTKAKLVFICNPNNPTGTYISPEHLKAYISQIPEDIYVVLDEAYIDFVDNSFRDTQINEKLNWHPRLIILRTFSKIFALAGLRIGIGISHPTIIKKLSELRMPFNVNSMAQSAVLYTLKDLEYVQQIKNYIIEERVSLFNFAHEMGYRMFPSQANFIAYDMRYIGSRKIESKAILADEAFEYFASHNIMVRSLKSFSMNDYIRITIGTKEENQVVKNVLKSWVAQ